jgi:hypothetical protein
MPHVEIWVKGQIDNHWSGWFDDMEITQTDQDETLLKGWVVDQSAVYGLLSRVRDLGLALVSVTLSEGESQEQTKNYPDDGGFKW